MTLLTGERIDMEIAVNFLTNKCNLMHAGDYHKQENSLFSLTRDFCKL